MQLVRCDHCGKELSIFENTYVVFLEGSHIKARRKFDLCLKCKEGILNYMNVTIGSKADDIPHEYPEFATDRKE